MQFKQIEFNSEEYFKALSLRESILRTPLGLKLSESDTAGEEKQLHFGLFANNELAACVVLKPINSNKIKLRQMAVSPDFQKQGLGKRLIIESESKIKQLKYELIEMSARETAVKFYEKLGYRAHGRSYIEQGISHIAMSKRP